jgi:hypothetical protein
VSAVRLLMILVCCQGRPIYCSLRRADPNCEAGQKQQISRRFRRLRHEQQENRRLIPSRSKRIFPSPKRPGWLRGPTQPAIPKGTDGKLAGAWSWPHLELDPRLKTEWIYISTPPYVFMLHTRTTLPLPLR